MADLILRGGRIVDPANARDEVADIAFSGGKVAAVGADLGRDGAEIVDVRGLIVAPGLIDMHTHVYWGGTSLGVDAGEVACNSGTRPLSMPAARGRAIFMASGGMSSSPRRCASCRS